MAKKSMAELIYTAYLTGDEAEFTRDGTTYEFTPDGLKEYIEGSDTEVYATMEDLDSRLSEAQRAAINLIVAPDPEDASQGDILQCLTDLIAALQE